MPVWEGDYTDSARVVARLQQKMITTDTPPPNCVTPVISDELITMTGETAEAEINQGLFSLGYKLPLTLTSETTQRILASVAEKEIICQLLISSDLKDQCCRCYDSVDLDELEKLCADYCSTLDAFLAGLEACTISLIGETKADHKPCESVQQRLANVPTTVAIQSSRSCTWRHPSQINF